MDRPHDSNMTHPDVFVSGMLSSHDTLQHWFDEVSVASAQLSLDPANVNHRAQWSLSQSFVRQAVAHMAEEESSVFEDAEHSGVPIEVLDALRREHARLRYLAAQLLLRREVDDEGALMMLRFLHIFDRHVAREEWALVSHLPPPTGARRKLRRRRTHVGEP